MFKAMRAPISTKNFHLNDLICSYGISHIICFCFVLNTEIAHSYLEQKTTGRNKSTESDELPTVNSKEGMHQKSNELVNEDTHEDTELPGQRSRNFPYPGDERADCTTKKSK